jgi:hypothetical protein
MRQRKEETKVGCRRENNMKVRNKESNTEARDKSQSKTYHI